MRPRLLGVGKCPLALAASLIMVSAEWSNIFALCQAVSALQPVHMHEVSRMSCLSMSHVPPDGDRHASHRGGGS